MVEPDHIILSNLLFHVTLLFIIESLITKKLVELVNIKGIFGGLDGPQHPFCIWFLLDLLVLLKELDLDKGIILFSGYTWDEINNIGGSTLECLDFIDLLIDGKFVERLKVENGLRGSSNQNFIYFSSKVVPEEVEFDRAIEVGESFLTGFPILDKKYLKQFGIKLL